MIRPVLTAAETQKGAEKNGAGRLSSETRLPSSPGTFPSAVPPLRLCVKPVRSARVSLAMIVRDEEVASRVAI